MNMLQQRQVKRVRRCADHSFLWKPVLAVFVAAVGWGNVSAKGPVLKEPQLPSVLKNVGEERPPIVTAVERSGVTLIHEAHQRANKARTAEAYSTVITLCQQSIDTGVTAETLKYARKLMSWAYNRRGEARADAGDEKEALQDFKAAVAHDRTRWRALHNRGVSFAMRGLTKKAIADFTRTIELNPKYANAYFNRGEMRSQLGQYTASLADYNRAIALSPDDVAAHNSRGHTYYQLEKYREAIRDFTEALRLDPANAAALTNRGDVYFDLGYYPESLRDYRLAIQGDPGLGRAHQSIAWLLATCPVSRFRDEAGAIAAAEKAIALDGETNPRYLDTLAAACAALGDFAKAQDVLQIAIQRAPQVDSNYRVRLALYEQRKPYRSRPKPFVFSSGVAPTKSSGLRPPRSFSGRLADRPLR